MAQEFGGLRRWAIRKIALTPPQTIEIEVQEQVASLLSSRALSLIELPLLAAPLSGSGGFICLPPADVLPDQARITAEVYPRPVPLLTEPQDITSGCFELLKSPEVIRIGLGTPINPPAHIDLFTELARPGRAGKAYTKTAKPQAKQGSLFDRMATGEAVAYDLDRCRHGLLRSQCDTCQKAAQPKPLRKRTTKRTGAQPTLDLFDLLLPYLQPPIHVLLSQPLLFPVGRRPHNYQIQGIKFLAEHTSALLGDEMGLGKTIQAIVALQVLYRRGSARRTLILCPRSLLGTWEREIEKFAPELYVQQVRGLKEERLAFWKAPSTIFLTTYETLRQDIDDAREIATRFDVIILDEVQKVKNASTGLARAVRRVRAQYRWGLSGTPLETGLEDVVSIFDYLKPGLFPPKTHVTVEYVKQQIAPYFLRRRTADVRAELPDKLVSEVWLELTESQQAAYDREEAMGKASLGSPGATRIHVFALINKLKQICNMDPSTGESCKGDYLEDQLDSIVDSGQKALVFSHLPTVSLSRLEPRLRSFGTATFDGSLSDSRREHLIRTFQGSATLNVLLMSVQAGGVGLTLTAANHVFHFDHWWNPAIARQAEGRAYRIGQTQTVFVHDIFTVGTVEEHIYNLLKDKQQLFDAVIDDLTADYVKGLFTDEDLFGIFGLKPPEPMVSAQSLKDLERPARASKNRLATPPLAARQNSNKLDELSAVEFEQAIANLYARMGFKTKRTPQSHDHGVDVIGIRQTALGLEKVIIQCKHMPNGTVGEPAVRDLIGAWQEQRDADSAVLVTSGKFSRAAVALAERHRIRLTDRIDLQRLMGSTFQFS